MKIIEHYAINWLKKKINITKHQEKLVLEFAREIEKLMEVDEEAINEQKN